MELFGKFMESFERLADIPDTWNYTTLKSRDTFHILSRTETDQDTPGQTNKILEKIYM